LANEEWKYDPIPEIIDGKNIADFIDPDIMAVCHNFPCVFRDSYGSGWKSLRLRRRVARLLASTRTPPATTRSTRASSERLSSTFW
jgi:hypothetical protein